MKSARQWVREWLFQPHAKDIEIERYPDAKAMVPFIEKVQADARAILSVRVHAAEAVCKLLDGLMLENGCFDTGQRARVEALHQQLVAWRQGSIARQLPLVKREP